MEPGHQRPEEPFGDARPVENFPHENEHGQGHVLPFLDGRPHRGSHIVAGGQAGKQGHPHEADDEEGKTYPNTGTQGKKKGPEYDNRHGGHAGIHQTTSSRVSIAL